MFESLINLKKKILENEIMDRNFKVDCITKVKTKVNVYVSFTNQTKLKSFRLKIEMKTQLKLQKLCNLITICETIKIKNNFHF